MERQTMIDKLENALVGLDAVLVELFHNLLPVPRRICMGELETIKEVIEALKQEQAVGPARA